MPEHFDVKFVRLSNSATSLHTKREKIVA